MTADKRLLGQYFTMTNPFDTMPFYKWIENHQADIDGKTILEPFAGANHIPRMIKDADILQNSWDCFDIEPAKYNNAPTFPITRRDTIANFPLGYTIGITNPPYLSKNSATRRGLSFPSTKYDDLYKVCLEVMLAHLDYVAAIIPETFITSGEFTDRLEYVISLTCKMFDDTECPVCLALFSKDNSNDYTIFQMNEELGKHSELIKGQINPVFHYPWIINDKSGSVGIRCVDNTKEPSIRFCPGDSIDPKRIKVSSRALTRVSGLPDSIDLDSFLIKCNVLLDQYRKGTKDVFMASFKGLRADGRYRRRLDFATAKQIMSQALWEMNNVN